MTRVALLPLDDRPVNYAYPAAIGRIASLEVLRPAQAWLGNPWRTSQHESLMAWLKETVQEVDGVVVAIDTLAHGGLVPSRVSSESEGAVLERLGILRELKASRPELDIATFSVIQRVSRDNASEEERPYWAEFGSRLFRLSYLEHKVAEGEATVADQDERSRLQEAIPQKHYQDYRTIRARNHAVNRAMLDYLDEGVIDYLVLAQDDTAAFGWNIAEARLLQAEIRARRLTERAVSYPGADELGCLLIARHACKRGSFVPKVWPRFSSSNSVVTAYEDRPLEELLKAHLAPLLGTVAVGAEDADILLFVNGPAEAQGYGELQWLIQQGVENVTRALPKAFQPPLEDLASSESFRLTQREMQTPARNPEEFVRALLAALKMGRPVALADVAFVNGADLILGDQLMEHPEIAELAAYAGWNTAGNTLGTALAQAALRALSLKRGPTAEEERAQTEFLFLRFLDDYAYQAHVRSCCMFEDLPGLGWGPTFGRLPGDIALSMLARVQERLNDVIPALSRLFTSSGAATEIQVENLSLPWQRLFELACDVRVNLQGPSRERR